MLAVSILVGQLSLWGQQKTSGIRIHWLKAEARVRRHSEGFCRRSTWSLHSTMSTHGNGVLAEDCNLQDINKVNTLHQELCFQSYNNVLRHHLFIHSMIIEQLPMSHMVW